MAATSHMVGLTLEGPDNADVGGACSSASAATPAPESVSLALRDVLAELTGVSLPADAQELREA